MLPLCALILWAGVLRAAGPVYVALWFDTEDYITPASDDAALRIATDLTQLGVQRDLQSGWRESANARTTRPQRRPPSAIEAFNRIPLEFPQRHPTPSEYLRHLGYLEGAENFSGAKKPEHSISSESSELRHRLTGSPARLWGPQSNLALRRMRIPVYLDEGSQVGLDGQPFWYGGLLYVFNMGEQTFVPDSTRAEDSAAYATLTKSLRNFARKTVA